MANGANGSNGGVGVINAGLLPTPTVRTGEKPAQSREAEREEPDVELMERLARGDRAALALLYERHAPLLLALGLRMLGDNREAEDVVHDAFLEAWRAAGDYDRTRGSVRAWLMLRMRSRTLDRIRSAGRRRVVSIDNVSLPESGNGDSTTSGAERLGVRMSLETLPAEQRRVLALGFYEGLSASEIAERLQVPVGTVKSRTAAALSKLRAHYKDRRGT